MGAGKERSRAHHQCRCGQWALFRFDPARNTQEESVSGPRMRPLFHCPQRAMKGGGVLELQTTNDCTDICMCPSIMLPAPITFSEAPKTLNCRSRSDVSYMSASLGINEPCPSWILLSTCGYKIRPSGLMMMMVAPLFHNKAVYSDCSYQIISL